MSGDPPSAEHPGEYVLRTPVPVAELDPFGELRPSAYIRLLQLTAAEASAAAGYDAHWYAQRGTTWIVRRTRFEQCEPARQGDDLRIRTWVSDIRRVRSWRRYEVDRAIDGQAIARAATDWVYVNSDSGAPTVLCEELQRAFMPAGVTTEPRPPRIRPPADGVAFDLRRVELADLDSLGHVNNATYVNFVQQALLEDLQRRGWTPDFARPEAGHLRARSLEIEYLTPALYREVLSARIATTLTSEGKLGAAVELVAESTSAAAAVCECEWSDGPLPTGLRAAFD
jgi:YbgC/YbaW family acyl-CoA thioester hydrolase